MASSTATTASSSTAASSTFIVLDHYTNYVNVHLSIDKLDDTNYDTWASNIRLWLKSQGYIDHLTTSVANVPENEVSRWSKIDAHAWFSNQPLTLKQIFCSYETCLEIWEHAKLLYTNDTQRLYGVCQNLLHVVASRRLDGTMSEYVGKIHALFHDLNELLSLASTQSQEIEQWSKFFMLLALYGLPDDYFPVRDQILGSPVVPTLTSTCSTLMRVSSKSHIDISTPGDDSSPLVSQRDDRTRSRKPSKGRHKCDHCGKLGHKIDRCYALHGRPPKTNVVVQATLVPPTMDRTSGPPAIFNEFLKWYEDRQNSGSTASVTHTGISFARLTYSSSLGPWVLDSGATDYITGNKSFFSSLSTFGHLPSITMANGSKVSSHGVGTVHFFPSLPIDNVLYVSGSLFNLLSISCHTHSLNCTISFIKDFVCLQDRSSGQMIGTGCESHGLYCLRMFVHVGMVMDSPSLHHAKLGHPSLAKMKQLVPSLSKLSSFSCESCLLEKHSRNSFLSSVSQRALSPFALVHSDI